MNAFDLSDKPFLFSGKYRVLRHLLFWTLHVVIFTFMFRTKENTLVMQFLLSTVWAVLFMVYIYPVLYIFIPRLLLKGRTTAFTLVMIGWGVVGWFWNYFCRSAVFFPVSENLGLKVGVKNAWAPVSYLTMCTMTGIAAMIVLFKQWLRKQMDYLRMEKERTEAELQVLKAQLHPHFLFNTLNNIYSFSLQHSDKTPKMILKLSSLLSYMLYDCKAEKVPLEKEMEVMRDYLDLEKERYGDRIEISVNMEGDVKGKSVIPLLFLPFLENAFKHGTAEQLGNPWLSFDVGVKKNILRAKVVNSKNEQVTLREEGIGIRNVTRRLALLYPGRHELKTSDEGAFFVVSLSLDLQDG